MEDEEITQHSSDRLEKVLSGILDPVEITSKLSQLLAYTAVKGTVSYQEVREIVKDDPEDILLLAEGWRLIVPVRTARSSSWEDRLLLLKDGEVYEIPNVIRYLVRDALDTGRWHPERAIGELFKELRDPILGTHSRTGKGHCRKVDKP